MPPARVSKTVIFCEIIKSAAANQKRALVLVRGRKLVDQASKRLFREKVEHGTLMARHWNYRPHLPIQVCSIDTIIARQLTPEADLIIIDEADLFGPKSKAAEFVAKYPNSFVVPVTATPWMEKGMSHLAETIVHPITMKSLIAQDYLCDFRYFAPNRPDLSQVHISSSTKDYVSDELAEVMTNTLLSGKIIDHWKELASDKATLCFAVNIAHSKFLISQFQAAGITAEHCDANTPDAEREDIIRRVECGETKIVCNVGVMGRGVDIPCVEAIIMARPTQSFNLFIQQAGRGTRTFPGKEKCLLLDHAGNIYRHGFPTDEPDVNLFGAVGNRTRKYTKLCPKCFCAFRGNECPECKFKPEEKEFNAMDYSESDERLTEIESVNPIPIKIRELDRFRKQKKYKKGWVYYQIVSMFGYEACKPYLPQWFIEKQERPDSFRPKYFR